RVNPAAPRCFPHDALPISPGDDGKHDSSEMPFLDHLEELRWALLKSIIVIVVAMIASWYLSDWFYNQVTELAKGGKSFLGNTTSDRKSTRLNSSHVKISYA